MKLKPRSWDWSSGPVASWLEECPGDAPLVWQAWLPDDPAVESRLLSLLSPAERVRRERLRLAADRRRFLTGRGLLRLFLGAGGNRPAPEVEFACGPAGKPFARPAGGRPAPFFNVSHSGQLVLLAFHPAREVGVDVEQICPDRDFENIARRIFPPDAYRQWARLNPDERPPGFFQAWTRHEARLKTLGRGIAGENQTVADARVACFDLVLPEGYAGACGLL